MIQRSGLRMLLAHPLRAVLWLVVLIVMLKAAIDGVKLGTAFSSQDNDDVMRLLSVRDWIAGQGWYDVAQYRLLPPDGVPLHWSRYIDVGIAALIIPFSFIFPMDVAELVAATLWPTMIMIIHLLVVGFGTQHIFGRAAACFAVLCVAFWPLTADLHSRAGQLDHHNVQLLMMVLLAFAVIWPSRPVVAGCIGGIAAAFSLAVGLESLPFIIGGGLAIFIRVVFLPSPLTRSLLFTFCAALGIGSVVFWLGQTPPVMRMQQVCDQLGPQTLLLVAVAILASTMPLLLHRWLKGPWLQLGAAAVLTAIGMLLVWPLLSGCLVGPYGALPEVIQETISGRITEAKPAFLFAQARPMTALLFLLPVLVSLFAGRALWGTSRRSGHYPDQALGLLLILCAAGVLMVFLQMRTVIMVASVVPVIGGVVAAHLLQGYLNKRDLTKGLLAIAVTVMMTSPGLFIDALKPFIAKGQGTNTLSRDDCLEYTSLRSLNAVPPGVLLSHINFGPGLIWATHHDGLSAPYHRSAKAMENGILPFSMNNADMAAYVRASPATHLLICRGYGYDDGFANTLANGGSADWLRPVAVDDDIQILFEVIRE
ncbi:hypothetical protein [Roseobacter sp. CCS2]|uniref:hypothetical protein n=1 Tax=Roseobacter sp. CCS2 TaxID=391593 RepID=UPI000680CA18|nr:hypothetical protein [Roseobacter sp. CCS2]